MNREGLLGDVMVREHPGQSDHAKIVFSSWGSMEESQQNFHVGLPESRESGLFRSLVDRAPWKAFLKGKGWTSLRKKS